MVRLAADRDKKAGLAMQCDKNEYRGILARKPLTRQR